MTPIPKEQLQAIKGILPYLKWTISDESPGYHPTMPSAVAAFEGALSALQSLDREGVTVKPLEWHGPDYEDEYWAAWLGGRYTIQAENGNGRWLGGVGGCFKSIEEAKAAAQADYERRILSALAPQPTATGHPDDLAVDRFAAAMKAKLAKKRDEGRGGWDRKGECSAEFLSQLLREHVAKGDPLDVGNLAMMLHQRGERIAPASDHESRQEAVAWLSLCTDGPYKGQFEVSETKPDRPPFNQMWADWFPVYAHPSPQHSVPAVVVDEATHRHKKRGTEYVLIGIGKMQAENWQRPLNPGSSQYGNVDMREVSIYRSVDDGSLWARPREEFEDGRFEALTAALGKE